MKGGDAVEKILAVLSALFSLPSVAGAVTWTSLINSTDFDGVRADVLTTAGGVISVVLVVLGLGILIRVLSR